MNLQQGFPLLTVPMVDPRTGVPTSVWADFFLNAWQRTGGAAGTPVPLTELFTRVATVQATVDETVLLSALDDAADPVIPVNLAPLQAAVADLQALQAMQDTHELAVSADQSTLLAFALSD